MIIRGRLNFNYIHGHYASLVAFRKKLQTASKTTSHSNVFSETFQMSNATQTSNWVGEFSEYEF